MTNSALLGLMRGCSGRCEGITLSGGEPIYQSAGLLELLQMIRWETHLSVLLYSGYTLEEIIEKARGEQILQLVDVLVAGRYDRTKPSDRSFLGSSNQRMHFLSSRYKHSAGWSQGELFINREGTVVVSGVQFPSMK